MTPNSALDIIMRDYDDPETEAQWCAERRQEVSDYLRREAHSNAAMGSDSIGFFRRMLYTAWCIALCLMAPYLRATRRNGISFTTA